MLHVGDTYACGEASVPVCVGNRMSGEIVVASMPPPMARPPGGFPMLVRQQRHLALAAGSEGGGWARCGWARCGWARCGWCVMWTSAGAVLVHMRCELRVLWPAYCAR